MVRNALVALAVIAAFAPAAAQDSAGMPVDLEGVGIDQRLDAQLPLELEFTDQAGRPVTLGGLMRPERPLLLVLAYYRCPMLCSLVLDGLVEAMQGIDWVPGREFDVVTLSIDPSETPELAQVKQQNYVTAYGRGEAAAGWHFLTGREAPIRALADAVGFRYRYVEERKEYAHAAVVFVVTPQGKISRYLFGIRHDPRTLRLSLVEASEGKVGSIVDQFLLYCYRYDAEAGRYAPVARKIMRVAGGLTVLALGTALAAFWRREARAKRLA